MKMRVLPSADEVARGAAEWLAARVRAVVAARGIFTMAVSGGRTPWVMLREFARHDLPWAHTHIFQVDERMAPEGHADRNWTQLLAIFEASPAAGAVHLHAMPVTSASLEESAHAYAEQLASVAGTPPVLDVVHLGLGSDGHTASLVAGDAALDDTAHDVAGTTVFQGRRRMTLTYPIINRARDVLWVVTGAEKREMVTRLLAHDRSIPAGRVEAASATLFVDSGAAPV